MLQHTLFSLSLSLLFSPSLLLPPLFIGVHLWRQFIATSRRRLHSQQLISKGSNCYTHMPPPPLTSPDPLTSLALDPLHCVLFGRAVHAAIYSYAADTD